MIINDLDDYYIVFDTKNRNMELDTLFNRILVSGYIKPLHLILCRAELITQVDVRLIMLISNSLVA